jgi:hypothetical protein
MDLHLHKSACTSGMTFRQRDKFTLTGYMGQESWTFKTSYTKTCMPSVQFLLVAIPLLPPCLHIKHAYEIIHWPSSTHIYTKWNSVVLDFSITLYNYIMVPYFISVLLEGSIIIIIIT